MCNDTGLDICVQCLVCKHYSECKSYGSLVFCCVVDCDGVCSCCEEPNYCGAFECEGDEL